MSLTDKQWLLELDGFVKSPAWPLLAGWYQGELVRQTMASEDPMAGAIDAAHDWRGACALLLAIENEVTNKSEAKDGRSKRAAARAQAASNGRRAGGAPADT